jgi:hypothetical protein
MDITLRCDNHRPVVLTRDAARFTNHDLAEDAAWIFAARQARKAYGARGEVVTVCKSGWAADHSYYDFEAFIGYRVKSGGWTGHNAHMHVTIARR